MADYKCDECWFQSKCPCGYSWHNAACLTIQAQFPSIPEMLSRTWYNPREEDQNLNFFQK